MNKMNDSSSALNLLLTRRSLVAAKMVGPGPNDQELEDILAAGLRVPDHGRAEPWRLQIIGAEGRQELVALQTKIFQTERAQEIPKKLELLNQITLCTPVMLVVTCYPNAEKFEKVPLLEQQLSGGALCQNILVAAHALGYVAQWITGWPAYHSEIKKLLGHDKSIDILGFIFIGSAAEQPTERPRPDPKNILSHWPK